MEKEEKKTSKSKIIILIVIAVLIISVILFFVKNINTKYYHIGDTVSTDIAKFTLNNSALTFALEGTNNENNYTPKEYDAEEDKGSPYVAEAGHTMAFFDFTLSAYDRSNVEIDVSNFASHSDFVNVSYKNKRYKNDFKIGKEKVISSATDIYRETDSNGKTVTKEKSMDWENFESNDILLISGDTTQYKGYAQIPLNIENLKDKYYITFNLPNSKGKTESFTFAVNE